MLVLTRKLKQQIQIGSNITITILRVQGNNVRIGIEAPQDVRVLRAELPIQVDLTLDDEPEAPVVAPVKTKKLRNFETESRNPGETTSRPAPLSAAVQRRRAPGLSLSLATAK